jgi:hypothetical protein
MKWLLSGYLALYFLVLLSPADSLILSYPELAWKAGGQTWFRFASSDAGQITALLGRLLGLVPVGLLLELDQARYGKRSILSAVWAAVLVGLVMGVFTAAIQLIKLEGVGYFIEPVLAAGAVVAGMLMGRTARHVSIESLRRILRATMLVAVPLLGLLIWRAYGFGLDSGTSGAIVSGRNAHRFIPFYLSYYGAEGGRLLPLPMAIALYLSVSMVLYVLSWGKYLGVRSAAASVALLAACLEVVRYFAIDGLIQTENILLAAMAGGLGVLVARSVARLWKAADSSPRKRGAAREMDAQRSIFRAGEVLMGIGFFGAGFAGAFMHPVAPLWLAGFLAVYSIWLWLCPTMWLWAIPAGLPLLAFSPWTGQIYFDEIDCFVLVTLGIGFIRILPMPVRWRLSSSSKLLLLLLTMSYLVSTLVGLRPIPAIDLNAFVDYASNFNSLRVLKGFLWALFLLPLLQRSIDQEERALERWIIPGLLAGLAVVSAVVLWERFAFVGLTNFSRDYRVTATFPEMHTGGMALVGYLTLTLPFILVWLSRRSAMMSRLFSNKFTAVAAYTVIVFLGLTMSGWIFGGRNPVSDIKHVLEMRIAHWETSTSLMTPGLRHQIFGIGLGRFQQAYYWSNLFGELPSQFSFQLEGESRQIRWGPLEYQRIVDQDDVYLTLAGGHSAAGGVEPLHFGQRVTLSPGQRYILQLQARSNSQKAVLTLEACDKWLLYPVSCTSQNIALPAKTDWREIRMSFIANSRYFTWLPLTKQVSIYNNSTNTRIDVDKVRLLDGAGRDLIVNGDFTQGNARWFFSSDQNLLPWQAQNMWVQVWLEQGWLGVITLSLLLFRAIGKAGEGWLHGIFAKSALAFALVSFSVVGFFDSLLDVPRITTLFFLLIWLALLEPKSEHLSKSRRAKVVLDR